MITKVEVYSSSPSAPELPLSAGTTANDDPIQIRDIQGLGPVKAEITTTPYASGRGELFQGVRTNKRNIVLTLGLNPNWTDQTISSLRQQLYAYLMPESWCKLRFFSDDVPTVDIEGYVESFEPNIFSQDPELQISVICPKPDFIGIDVVQISGETILLASSVQETFDYAGSVPTGIEVRVDWEGVAYTGKIMVVVKSPTTPQVFEVDPITVNGTTYFRMSSVRNIKRVQNISLTDGAITNKLQVMTADSVWPELQPGTNHLQVKTTTTGMTFQMAYFAKYGAL